jgi:hypothetical protein
MEELLEGFKQHLSGQGEKLTFPLDIDRLIEQYLCLGYRIVPLAEEFPSPCETPSDRFWGCLHNSPREKGWTVFLDENLVEQGRDGPVSFSAAHEVAHYTLDVPPGERNGDQLCLELPGISEGYPRILCRARDARSFTERRADYAAACLLAPAREVCEAFRSWKQDEGLPPDLRLTPEERGLYWRAIYALAEKFGVSATAMSIRFDELDLARREGQMLLT